MTNKDLNWALNLLPSSKVDADDIRVIFENAMNAETFIKLVQALNAQKLPIRVPLKNFISTARESRFPLKEWIEALVHFFEYNQNNKLTSRLDFMVDYMACSAHSEEAKMGQVAFTAVVLHHLRAFGFENGTKS